MTYAVLYIENGDIVASYATLEEARTRLADFVADHSGAEDEMGILAYDETGHAVGEFEPASGLVGREYA